MEPPFSTIQILWANIFADIPPALSLGLEPPEVDIMERKPRPTKQNVLTKVHIIVILFQSLFMTLITFTVYYQMVHTDFLGADTTIKRQSTAFILLCSMQLVQSFLSRSVLNSVFKTGITGNKILVAAFFIAYGLLLFGLLVPPVAAWLELSNPSGAAWGLILGCVVLHIILVETLKFVLRRIFTPPALHSEENPRVVMVEGNSEKVQ